MTDLQTAFEALMPEPAFQLRWHSVRAAYSVSKPDIGDTEVYTADQMRQAIQAASDLAAKREREDGVVIAAYALPVAARDPDVRIERARQINGSALWAVRRVGTVLNKQGEWEWEPMPSNRDDEFLARTRFDSADEAIAAAIRARDGGTS